MESKFFISLIVIAMLLGLAVLVFNPNYRLGTIWESNAEYYPMVNFVTMGKE